METRQHVFIGVLHKRRALLAMAAMCLC